MIMKRNVNKDELPAEVAELLANTPKTTQKTLDRIAAANRKLENDPEFLAEVERAKFVNDLLEGMEQRGVTVSELAKRIGKSRQYVHRVLNEDNRVSFTLKTMITLCHAVGLRYGSYVADKNETKAQFSIQYKGTSPVHLPSYTPKLVRDNRISVATLFNRNLEKDTGNIIKANFSNDVRMPA